MKNPKKILTRKGEVILVDARDYEAMAARAWYVNKDGYAQTMVRREDGRQQVMMMHRLLLGAADGMRVDHRNRSKLDNTRGNIRLATASENSANRVKNAMGRNRFKGIIQDGARWYAKVKKGGREYTSPRFFSDVGAAVGYDILAKALHGEFARLNFPSLRAV